MVAAKFPLHLRLKKPKKLKTWESNRMSRRRAIRNSVRANALLAAIEVLVNRENRASHASQESLVNRAAAIGLPAAWIVAIAAQATGVHVTLIAEIEAVTAAVAATAEIVANVRRCANARRWIEIVDRAMIAVDVATAIAGRVILIVETVADAKIVAARAITIVLAKAIVVHVIMIVLLPVVAALGEDSVPPGALLLAKQAMEMLI